MSRWPRRRLDTLRSVDHRRLSLFRSGLRESLREDGSRVPAWWCCLNAADATEAGIESRGYFKREGEYGSGGVGRYVT